MKIVTDCIPCILKMAVTGMRDLPLKSDNKLALFKEILEIPALRGRNWDITPPEIIEDIMKKIIADTGMEDPFAEIKKEQNEQALRIYPFLNGLVQESEDPLYTAVKLAALGNSIDLMMTDSQWEIENLVREKIDFKLPAKAYDNFLKHLKKSSLLVYTGDNAGEVVFDRVLIETIRKKFDTDIVFIVRKHPALNDTTRTEAVAAGLDKVVKIVENGIDGPLPGTILDRCSLEVKELFEKSDFIISKGGGNLDTLGEEITIKSKTAFILISKCDPVVNVFNVPLYDPILDVPEIF